jgi:hypothetical protein
VQVTKDDLRKTYRKLSNGEIEHLIHHESSFLPIAKEVLKEEVKRRRLPSSWAERVDEKGDPPRSGRYTGQVSSAQPSSGPSSIIGEILGFLFSGLPGPAELAFFGVWLLLCYIAYHVVNYLFFS